jgi:hypothetical protein
MVESSLVKILVPAWNRVVRFRTKTAILRLAGYRVANGADGNGSR